MKLEIEYNNYGRSYSSDGGCGDWYDNKNIVYDKAIINEKYGEPIDFIAKEGDIVYVVEVVYESGDSFGRSTGNSEIVWVVETEDEACKIKRMIIEDIENPKTSNEFTSLPYKGRDCIYTGSWKGYFEHFTECNVIELLVKND